MNNELFPDEVIEEDELDLLELVSADTNSTNQYLIFIGSDDEVYAINVSKVQELLVYKNLHMTHNPTQDSIIRATADIRDNMTTIINFDEWYGNKVLDNDAYELIILAAFGGYNLGIMIKSVEYIMNINLSNMQDNSANNPKTNFVAKIRLNGVERLCTIFDGDRMLLDVFPDTINTGVAHIETSTVEHKNKLILFADDSRLVRKMVVGLFNKLGFKSRAYDNGLELLEDLDNIEIEDIGLIVTDLEMPIMDGTTLMKKIQEAGIYSDINVLVHTNMSNDVMKKSLEEYGAVEVIRKIDLEKLSIAINKYYK
ncbi:MAG: hypothetical protein DRG78_12540 [Epsilonproteobacteria bacterium]|nr:MAG: hypothetical protein DRG78_12540 [Campylobacterota bacterium]